MTVRGPKKALALAGCLECNGSTPIWTGKHSHESAYAHARATGHTIWRRDPGHALPNPRPERLEQPAKPTVASAAVPAAHPEARLSKRNMCDGKVAHASAAAAQKAIDNTRHDRTFLNVYQCLYCGKFHVGHIIKPWIDPKKRS